MAKIKCLVVDDEALARKLLASHIAKVEDFEQVGECGSALHAKLPAQKEGRFDFSRHSNARYDGPAVCTIARAQTSHHLNNGLSRFRAWGIWPASDWLSIEANFFWAFFLKPWTGSLRNNLHRKQKQLLRPIILFTKADRKTHGNLTEGYRFTLKAWMIMLKCMNWTNHHHAREHFYGRNKTAMSAICAHSPLIHC